MGQDEITILVVDDDDATREAHCMMLEAYGFHTLQAEDGKQALTLVKDSEKGIGIIVTDVMMPVMDGYQLCEKIRECENIQSLPILFVSALDTLEEKIKGYSAGGNDYIVKPVIPDELNSKIRNLLKIQNKTKDLKQMLQDSTQAAMQAMHYSADLGQILEFYKNSLSAPDFKTIADLLFDVTDSFGLKCLLQIYTPTQQLTYSHEGQASPLEKNVMELARGKTRFLDFGPRTIINYKDFSLLVKNMPLDEPERYGSLKDSLGNLCNAIEARIAVILSDDAQERKKRVLATIREALDDISADFNRIQKENISAIESMIEEIEKSYLSLGLTEQQEENISTITKQCLDKSNENFFQGIAVKERFEDIHRKLIAILG